MAKRSLSELFRRLKSAFVAWWGPAIEGDTRIGVIKENALLDHPRYVVDLSQLEPFGAVRELCEHEDARDLLGMLVLDPSGLAWEVVEIDGRITARVVSAIVEMTLEERRAIAHERVRKYSEELADLGVTMAEMEQRGIQHALIVARQAEANRRKQFDAMIASGRFRSTDDPVVVEFIEEGDPA